MAKSVLCIVALILLLGRAALSVPYWSDWTTWSHCTCNGQHERTRWCYHFDLNGYPTPATGCHGHHLETKWCITNWMSCSQGTSMDLPAAWSEWTTWSNCTCNGQLERTRTCYQYHEFGPLTPATSCLGRNIETNVCIRDEAVCDLAVWSEWTEWSSCTCNGELERTRTCHQFHPAGPPIPATSCHGINIETMLCTKNETACHPGVWNMWSDWSNCSESCNTNYRIRTRNCTNVEYTKLNNDCQGPSVDYLPCPEINCTIQVSVMSTTSPVMSTTPPVMSTTPPVSVMSTTTPVYVTPTDPPGNWTNWSSWSYCTVTCGGGVTYRTRHCTYDHKQVNNCPGHSVETENCTNNVCDVAVMNTTSASVTIAPGIDSSEQSTTISASHTPSTSHPVTEHAILDSNTLSTIVSMTVTTPASVTIAPGIDSSEHLTTTPASHTTTNSHAGSQHAVLTFSTLSTIVSNTTAPASVTIARGSDANELSTTTPASHITSTNHPGSQYTVLDLSTLSIIVSMDTITPASVTIAPGSDSSEHSTTTPDSQTMITSHSGTQPQSTTANTTTVTTSVTKAQSISCFECTDDPSGCEYNYQPVTCSSPNNYCINDLTNNGDASRVIIRRCGNYDECVNDWWQTYSDNELCKNFNQDTPYNVAFNCKFCCVKDACNENINPPKETNFVKN